jgi:hypothetical protein
MAKTNYSKVEELLSLGQERLKIQGWIDMTKVETTTEEPNPKAYLIFSLTRGLDLLPKGDTQFLKDLNIEKADIQKWIKEPEKLDAKDWALVKEIQQKLKAYLAKVMEALPELSNEDLIEAERIKHLNKRYNTRDKWLPLH